MNVMSPSDLFAIMQSRRSVRRYQDAPIPEVVLRRILQAAVWAPSAHNRQPWRFAVLTSEEKRLAMARAMADQFRVDLRVDGVPDQQINRQVNRSIQRIGGSPAVVVVCMSMADMDTYPDARRQEAERMMAAQSVALAAQNLLLMAHAEGLGACWMCAPLFVPDIVRRTLDLPDDWSAQGLLTLGYPAEERVSERAPIETKWVWY